jgi:hypothetical protein
MCVRCDHRHYFANPPFDAVIVSGSFLICPQAGRPRHRNAAASGAISHRSNTPAKAAYAATGIIFLTSH